MRTLQRIKARSALADVPAHSRGDLGGGRLLGLDSTHRQLARLELKPSKRIANLRYFHATGISNEKCWGPLPIRQSREYKGRRTILISPGVYLASTSSCFGRKKVACPKTSDKRKRESEYRPPDLELPHHPHRFFCSFVLISSAALGDQHSSLARPLLHIFSSLLFPTAVSFDSLFRFCSLVGG
ncbi:hypothetical protein ACLOJK_030302 [Asimina triloba]